MAESNRKDNVSSDLNQIHANKQPGCFDFLVKKKEGETEQDVVIEEPQKEKIEDLRRLHSQSSSSSDEEFEGERKKNKKTIADNNDVDTDNDSVVVEVDHEKKGALEKIKEHLVGKHNKTEEGIPMPEVDHATEVGHFPENEKKEKKGIIEKIKEKLQKNGDEELDEKKEN